MKIDVYDTYVTKKDDSRMHFDILVKKGEEFKNVLRYGQQYLKVKGQAGQQLSTEECSYCHMEDAKPATANLISDKGYAILEMEGC